MVCNKSLLELPQASYTLYTLVMIIGQVPVDSWSIVSVKSDNSVHPSNMKRPPNNATSSSTEPGAAGASLSEQPSINSSPMFPNTIGGLVSSTWITCVILVLILPHASVT